MGRSHKSTTTFVITLILPQSWLRKVYIAMISTSRATPFKIHDENGGKSIKAAKSSSSKGLGDSSVLKTGQKSQRKALSSISNNQLNARALSGLKEKSEKAVIKDSKPMVHFSLDTPLQKEKQEPLVDVVSNCNIFFVVGAITYVFLQSEMLVSGPYIKCWDEVPDEFDRHVFEQEKLQMMQASIYERKILTFCSFDVV